MQGTLSKRHKGHRSHIKGKTFASRNKKAQAFYESDEKRLRKKYIRAGIVQRKNKGFISLES